MSSGASRNVAVVGAGHWGKNLVRTFDQLGALAVVCDPSQAALEDARRSAPGARSVTSFDDVLNDQSIVAIALATPAAMHASHARRVLLAGKDVFVEKPLCLDVDEGSALVELARARSRILMVGHVLRYHPAIGKLKELIDAGELGRLQYIYSTRLNLGKFRREENILWSFAPHDISVILGLTGEMPDSIQAHAGTFLQPNISDVTVSLMSFPSGTKAHVFVSWLHPYKEQKLVVVGDRGMAVFDDQANDEKLVIYPHTITWKNQLPLPTRAEGRVVTLEWREPLVAECAHFLSRIADRQPPLTDGLEALRVLTVLDQCQKATANRDGNSRPAKTGRLSPPPSNTVHEPTFTDEDVRIGEGTTIGNLSHVLTGSRIGKNCRLGRNVVIGPRAIVGSNVRIESNVSVGECVTLEDDVSCGPSVVFSNVVNPRSETSRRDELRPTLVMQGATLGANCTIFCGATIGRYAFVAAGAVVTADVPDHALVVGVPARRAGWVCRCGVGLEFREHRAECAACKVGYQIENGLVMAEGKPT
jgi:UDP-2-acetamido-3-amino-2,3-dideoxy-glucuronate N-acetyltransferase